jgi:hypothetical protein
MFDCVAERLASRESCTHTHLRAMWQNSCYIVFTGRQIQVSLETNMPNPKHDSILDVILARPWWVSFTLSAVAYVAWRFVPPLIAGHPHLEDLSTGLMRVAPPLSIMFAAVVPVALLSGLRRRRLRKNAEVEHQDDTSELSSRRRH